jgi:cytidyltransferase-like protein
MDNGKMVNSKIVEFESLKKRISVYQQSGKRVVLCYGEFAVLHVGHIRYLKQAAQYGDVVVVVLTPDYYDEHRRKEHPTSIRAEAIAYLDWVDAITVSIYGKIQEVVNDLMPDVYSRGFESVHDGDISNQQRKEEEYINSLGIEVVVAKENGFYSTDQINRYLSSFSENIMSYIRLFKQRYSIEDVIGPIEKIKKMKIMVIGDTILDEYQYCHAIGKSSKDPTLALKYESKDLFAGGVLAIANHISNFAEEVDIMSVLGETDSHEDFILSELSPNIKPNFVLKPNSPTLIKRRFLDGDSTHKLFEVYVMDDSYLPKELDNDLCRKVEGKLKKYDSIIVADYGHGTISNRMIEVLTGSNKFLAVNTQSNAGNRGYNTISKYRRADYICLAEHEVRLETRDLDGSLASLINKISKKMSCRQFAGTRGRKGCMIIDERSGLVQIPSFAKSVVDRVGAGDAFFSLTSLLSSLSVQSEILGLVGNVAGSLATEIMGNKKPVDKQSVTDYLEALLSD